MTVTDELNETIACAEELGIPEYLEMLSDEEIISLALYYFRKHMENDIDDISEAINDEDVEEFEEE